MPPGMGTEDEFPGEDGSPAPFSRVTRNIRVSVRTVFLEDQSQPDEHQFLWAYRIRIENLGGETVRLLRRTWLITDGNGRAEQVTGDGVVGEQPQLGPGEAFEYTSGTPLGTPSGFMTGHYQMAVIGSNERFDVAIPTFSLDSPHQPGILH
ncbi:Co2+/Mg2+ efflux protein ApaG [Acetobacteraceae bacterium KSS8]|uniref:Protein ApaG n=1 Tax=Endosaccharibacter trunci TaxID=2812733 RepID=A0ABT1W6L4_9PROT|nr:Co2+/Mg2+ efflux protein ApaG [Acetobacteraceae bacterium KSS8]